MNIHKNALATPYSRLPMARGVGAGERAVNVAADSCVSEQTVRKWVQRRQGGGENALLDRSSRRARVRGRSRSGCKACCVAFFALAFCARRLKVRQDARVIFAFAEMSLMGHAETCLIAQPWSALVRTADARLTRRGSLGPDPP